MNMIFDNVGIAIGAHFMYFVISLAVVALFIAIYIAVTPYREINLIREGNTAAAVSLGGAVIGFSIPLAMAVEQSGSLVDMLLWSGVALVAQLLAYVAARLTLPHLATHVHEGRLASAVFLAALSISIGLLNAAAMTD
jgi:putative membrane protein